MQLFTERSFRKYTREYYEYTRSWCKFKDLLSRMAYSFVNLISWTCTSYKLLRDCIIGLYAFCQLLSDRKLMCGLVVHTRTRYYMTGTMVSWVRGMCEGIEKHPSPTPRRPLIWHSARWRHRRSIETGQTSRKMVSLEIPGCDSRERCSSRFLFICMIILCGEVKDQLKLICTYSKNDRDVFEEHKSIQIITWIKTDF